MPTPAPSARVPEGQEFFDAWHALDATAQRRIRRLVKIGRPVEPAEALLAVGYARFQAKRPWQRFFWFWFVPGLLLALGIGITIHPVVVGLVIGMAVVGARTHVNLTRAEAINRKALRLAAS